MANSRFNAISILGKVALAGSILAGCATHPDNIKPVSYAGAKCTAADRARLAALSDEQKRTAKNDTIGVLLLGVPVGSMAGKNHKDEIAWLKGACG